ncbi:hypothetical protein [Magnetospirillum fulvum]|nr:hypothetical protein [Magnetospirillum fulvum]
MKNESFWLIALIAVVLFCAALEVQQSNSANDSTSPPQGAADR